MKKGEDIDERQLQKKKDEEMKGKVDVILVEVLEEEIEEIEEIDDTELLEVIEGMEELRNFVEMDEIEDLNSFTGYGDEEEKNVDLYESDDLMEQQNLGKILFSAFSIYLFD